MYCRQSRAVLGQGLDGRIRDLPARASASFVNDGQLLAKASMPATVRTPCDVEMVVGLHLQVGDLPIGIESRGRGRDDGRSTVGWGGTGPNNVGVGEVGQATITPTKDTKGSLPDPPNPRTDQCRARCSHGTSSKRTQANRGGNRHHAGTDPTTTPPTTATLQRGSCS